MTLMKKKKRKSGLLRGIMTLLILVVVAVIVITLVSDRGGTMVDTISQFLFGSAANAEEFYFDAGDESVFADLDGSLALASTTGIQLFDRTGEAVAQETVILSSPAIYAEHGRAAVYDLGGTVFRMLDGSGIIYGMETEKPIISATVNESGYVALATQEDGYRGSVTVYDETGAPAYKWYSGEGYVLLAAVSPDNKRMAALTLTDMGSRILSFHLDSEAKNVFYERSGKTLMDMKYTTDGTLLVLAEDALIGLDKDGTERYQITFSDRYLNNYSMNSNEFTAVVLNDYQVGNQGQLLSVDGDGYELGTLTFSRDVLCISAAGGYLAVLYSDGLTIYRDDMSEYAVYDDIGSAGRVLMRSNGTAIVISSYSAMVYGR